MHTSRFSRGISRFANLFIVTILGLNAVLTPASVAVAAPMEAPQAGAFTSCVDVTEIPQAECEALVALYNSTDGANWIDNTSWLQMNMPCSWYGVTCDGGFISMLSMFENNLTGNLPPEIGNLTHLTHIQLHSNHLSGDIPPELWSLSQLINLFLGGGPINANQLTGTIPPEIENMTSLIRLDLSWNSLSGNIPAQLGSLDQLLELNLQGNQFDGHIPSELGSLSQLGSLHLGYNQLTGSIPPSLGYLSELGGLYLPSNQLTGNLPTEIGNLTNLTGLYTDGNFLTGEIPSSITNLTNLNTLTLSCGLTSTDPTVIAFLDVKSPGWQDNQCLQDPILLASGLSGPFGMDFDQSGNLFVANENWGGTPSFVSKIEPDGTVSTFAENFLGVAGLAFNSAGVLHVSDDTGQVFQIDSVGNVTAFIPNTTGLANPNAIAFDASDNLYVLSAGGFVSKFDSAGNLINLNLATGFNTPQGIIADDAAGLLYISDADGNIFQVDMTSGAKTLWVSTGFFTDGGLAMSPDGDLFASSWSGWEITRIDSTDQSMTTCVSGINYPRGLTFDSSGKLYFTEYDAGNIYWITECGGDLGGGTGYDPHIDVWYQDGHINAYNWPLSTTLTLEVEDPGTPASPDYFTTTTAGVAPWDDTQSLGEFWFEGAFNIEPGMTVTVSGDSVTRELLVSNLTITDIDPDADTITGIAEVDQSLWMHWDDNPDGYRELQADGSGNWTVDYSQVGLYGEPIQNIQPGSSGNINARDDDGDNTSVHWYILSPSIAARLNQAYIDCWDWPLGSTLTLEIDDPNVVGDVNYTDTTVVADGDSYGTSAWFDLVDYSLKIGDIITVSDGIMPRTHTVMNITITEVDEVNETVTGTTDPYEDVWVRIRPVGTADRYVQADELGDWSVYFSVPGGPTPDEQAVYDIKLGSRLIARVEEGDGDFTSDYWGTKAPSMYVGLNNNSVFVQFWPTETVITLTIDDDLDPGNGVLYQLSQDTLSSNQDSTFYTDFRLSQVTPSFTLMPGQYVTVTDGIYSKDTWIENVTFDYVNEENDTAGGTGPAIRDATVWLESDSGQSWIDLLIGSDTNWQADFGAKGYDIINFHQATIDVWDEDGDSTVAGLGGSISGTVFEADGSTIISYATVDVSEWDTGNYIGSFPADENGHYSIGNLNPGNYLLMSFKSGYAWEMYQGTLSKNEATPVLVVVGQETSGIDFTLDPGGTISGVIYEADGTTPIPYMAMEIEEPGGIKDGVCADDTGAYSFDWVPYGYAWRVRVVSSAIDWCGGPDGYPEMYWQNVYSWDDATSITLDSGHTIETGINFSLVPVNPKIEVWGSDAGHQLVKGLGWPLGASVTLEVDDPSNGAGVDFTDTKTVGTAPWNPSQTLVEFDLWGFHEFQPGDQVSLTDGTTPKSHTVLDVEITGVDPGTDIVSGVAAAGSQVAIEACWDGGCTGYRTETADPSTGVWSTDFNDGSGGQPTHDIVSGNWVRAERSDADGDSTYFEWSVPFPRFTAMPDEERVTGKEWDLGASVTLEIDDPDNGVSVDYTDTQVVIIDPSNSDQTWLEFDFLGSYDLQSGDQVSLSDGVTTKTHIVTVLEITGVDPATDIVTGVAGEGSLVEMWACWDGAGCPVYREETADGTTGIWTTDFSDGSGGQLTHDIVPGTTINAMQRDGDGDATLFGWDVLNTRIHVFPGDDFVDVADWPFGTTVSLQINGSPYGDLLVDGWAPWNPSVTYAEFDLGGLHDIVPGDVVVVTDGVTTKEHTVTGLTVTDVDPETNTVSGTTDTAYDVQSWVSMQSASSWTSVTPVGGLWTTDLSPFDLLPGHLGLSVQADEDGDRTQISWYIPNPVITVQPDHGWVKGLDWPLGNTVTLTVDNDSDPGNGTLYQDSITVTEYAYFDPNITLVTFYPEPTIDLLPGQYVTVGDGLITKQLLVDEVYFDYVDIENDTADGRGPANKLASVNLETSAGYHQVSFNINPDGTWLADFGADGFDIPDVEDANIQVYDDDGDLTMAHLPSRTLHVVPTYPEVHGHDWHSGSTVTLTIDDDNDPGNGVLYTETKNADDEPLWCGYPCFDLDGVFTLEVGQYISLSDGEVTKTVQISPLVITDVDTDAETVSGMGDPGARVAVNIWSQNGIARYVTVESDGTWVADFSVVGDEDFEQETTDIAPGDDGRAVQLNPDGSDDGTLEYWNVLSPYFEVRSEENVVDVFDWPMGASVSVEVNGSPVGDPQVVGPAHWDPNINYAEINLNDLHDFVPGDVVVVTDGVTTKQHTVTALTITGMDADTNTISGTTDSSFDVESWTHNDYEGSSTSVAPAGGSWVTNLSPYDLTFGEGGMTVQYDEDGDGTALYWKWPFIEVRSEENIVDAFNWPLGAMVSVEINGSPVGDPQVIGPAHWEPSINYAEINLNGLHDFTPGDVVIVSDGVTAKQHTVTALTITEINAGANTLSGTTDSTFAVESWEGSNYGDSHVSVLPVDGNWITDLSPFDLVPGHSGMTVQYDDDSDGTSLYWDVPNPQFTARFPQKEVRGYQWPLGASVTVSIDDPGNGTGEDYSDTQTVIEAPWDSSQTYVEFPLDGFDLQAGHIITMSDGETTKEHTVSILAVYGYDTDADTIYGSVEPGSQLYVDANCEGGCIAFRHEIADSNGKWSADFGIPGEDGNEQEITDIYPGSIGLVNAPDWDGDQTEVEWYAPNSRFHAEIVENVVEGYDWQKETLGGLPNQVTLSIDDPSNGVGEDFTDTQPVGDNAHVQFHDLGDIVLEPGMEIAMSDGLTTKFHVVTDLVVTGVDPDLDTVWGTGTPGTTVWVQYCENGCYHRRTATIQTDSTWQVDFSVPGGPSPEEQNILNIVPGMPGEAEALQGDEDTDITDYRWYIPNPTITVHPDHEWIDGYDWPIGIDVTVTVDDDTDPGNGWLYQETKVVVPDEWDPLIGYVDFYPDIDMQPGQFITMTDGATTKYHTIYEVHFDDVDVDTDIATGRGPADRPAWVWVRTATGNRGLDITIGNDGNWEANFGAVGFDIQDLQAANIQVYDEDDDATMAHLRRPFMDVRVNENAIEAWNWPLDAEVNITIDDTSTPESPDYTGSAFPYVPDWDSSQTFLRFDLPLSKVDLHTGVYVMLTNGTFTRTHYVLNIAVTDVDVNNDTVSGTSAPGQGVWVYVWGDNNHIGRYEVADGSGNWTADFSTAGDEDWEVEVVDILPGMQGTAGSDDADWDSTSVVWHAGWTATGSVPLVVAIDQDVSLENYLADTNTSYVLNLLMETLYRNDSNGNLMPAAALDCLVSPDGLTYTVTLRPDGYWSDGTPVTAQHYVDGLIYLLDPATGFNYPSLFYPILNAQAFNEGSITDPNLVGVSAPNASTLVFTLAQPSAHFAQLLSFPSLLPVRTDLMTLHGAAWAEAGSFVGNGPYQLDERDGAHLLLSHNPHYRNLGRLAYSQIGFSVIPAYKDRLAAYQNGDVDVLFKLPEFPSDPTLAADAQVLPWPGVAVLGFNVSQAPTNDSLVRMALASAIDRRHLLDVVMEMPWRSEATGVIPPELPGYQGGGVGYDYNPTQAQAYLTSAGYPGGAGLPPIELIANTGHEVWIEEIAAQWSSVLGITVNTTYYPWSEYPSIQQDCKTNPSSCTANALRGGWIMDYPDAYNVLNDLFHPNNGIYTPGWDNTGYTDLLTQSELETDPVARLLLLQDAERILVETDAAMIPVYHYDQLALVRSGIFTTTVPLYFQYLDLWGNSDVDNDGLQDLVDPCPEDDTNTCDPEGSAGAVVDSSGGTVATENGNTTMDIPPGAVSENTTFTITDNGAGYILSTDQGEIEAVTSVEIGPGGTTFSVPVPLTFSWPDDNPDDGLVDGAGYPEATLQLSKDGVVIAACSDLPAPCDFVNNTITVEVSSLSVFVLGHPSPNHPPSVHDATFSVNEFASNGTVVGTVTYSDSDSGQNHTCEIHEGNTDNAFTIDPDTCEITVNSSTVLDYDINPSFDLTVRVTDDGTPAKHGDGSITVNVTDSLPCYTLTLTSGANGGDPTAAPAKSTACPSDGQYVVGESITLTAHPNLGYQVASWTGTSDDTSTATTNTLAMPASDRTVNVTYEAVSNGTPTDITLSNNNVDENQPSMTIVGTLDTVDPDIGDTFTYTFCGGTDDSSFSIDGDTLKTASSFDFETKASYSVCIQSTDSGSLSTTKAFSISVNDVNEPPGVSLSNTTTSLPENTATTIAVHVADITVSDDALGTNTLSLSGADAALFEITGGALYIKSGTALDFETNPVLNVTVEVDDASIGDAPDDSAPLVISITDVDEILPTVQSVSATDTTPTNTAVVHFTVTFSESVTGVDTSSPYNDFALMTTGGITGESITDVSGSGSTYTVTVDTGSGSGTIRLDVVADGSIFDASSNPLTTGFTSGDIYEIDKTPPGVSITTGPASLTNSASATFEFTSPDAGATFECRLDADSYSGCSSPITYNGLGEGPHAFFVRASDAAGNQSAASHFWEIDTTPPDTSIDSYPDDPSSSTSASFTFSSTGGGTAYECQLDGAGYEDCTSPKEYTDLVDGAHTFDVRARDGAGNLDPTPASYGWTVAAPPFVVSIIPADASPTSAALVNYTVTFSKDVTGVDASDFTFYATGSITGYAITAISPDTGPASVYTVTVDTGMYDGTLRLDVVNDGSIQDASGNPLESGYTNGGTYEVSKAYAATLRSQGKYDGWILESSETSGKGGTKNNTSKVFYVGDDASNRQYRSILSFNTAGIPDDAVITKITLKIKKAGLVGTNPLKTHGGLYADIRKNKFGTSKKLQLSDFQARASKNKVGRFRKASSGWYKAALGSGAYPYINMTGTTQFRVRFAKDDNNDFGADYMKFYSGNAGTSSRPQLIVEYYVE